MKFAVSIIAAGVLTFVAQSFLPWWSLALACFVVFLLFSQGAMKSFFGGFIAVFLLWMVLFLLKDGQNDGILSEKIATLFSLNTSIVLFLISSLIGGFTGGISALAGNYLRELVKD